MKFKKNRRIFFYFFVVAVIFLLAGFAVSQRLFIQSIPVNQNLPWHTLQQVSDGSVNHNSVDSDNNKIIDYADVATTGMYSYRLEGYPASEVDLGCVSLDTGFSGGDSFKGTLEIDLDSLSRVTGTWTVEPYHENICEDANGCTYNVLRYRDDISNPTPSGLFSEYPASFFQFSSNHRWIEKHAVSQDGKNGDSNYEPFVTWNDASGGLLLEIKDDSAVESSPDKISIRDADDTRSYLVWFCD